jgi:hypothetical protein
MWNNPLASRMIGTPTMCTCSLRRSMDLRKPQEHSMNALEISLFLMLLRSGKLIILFLLRLAMMICSYVGMAAGRVLFGYNNTRPEIVPETSTNIHTHQANRARNCTRTHAHRVSTGYRVSNGYVIVD